MPTNRRTRFSRREALSLIGMSAAGVVTGCGPAQSPPPPTAIAGTSVPGTPAVSEEAIIRTILRDMSPDELARGATLFHEHVSMNNQFWIQMNLERLIDPSRPYFMENLDFMVAEMQAAADDGVVCIVDAGHTDMGRSMEFLRQLSERSEMPIVASGGYYHEPTYPPGLSERSEDDLLEELVRDATTERWGASGKSASPRRVHRMSGRCFGPLGEPTCRPTCRSSHTPPTGKRLSSSSTYSNRSVSTPDAWPLGTSAIRRCRFTEHSANAARMSASTAWAATQTPTLRKCRWSSGSWRPVTRTTCCYRLILRWRQKRGDTGGWLRQDTDAVVPLLREAGVEEEVLRGITSDNPRRFLAFVPPAV